MRILANAVATLVWHEASRWPVRIDVPEARILRLSHFQAAWQAHHSCGCPGTCDRSHTRWVLLVVVVVEVVVVVVVHWFQVDSTQLPSNPSSHQHYIVVQLLWQQCRQLETAKSNVTFHVLLRWHHGFKMFRKTDLHEAYRFLAIPQPPLLELSSLISSGNAGFHGRLPHHDFKPPFGAGHAVSSGT